MSVRTARVCYGVAFIASAGMWLSIALPTGNTEAWDHPLYFLAGLPSLAVIVAALGFAVPERAWRCGLVAGAAQVVSLFVLQRSVGSLLPVGMLLLALITVGLVLAALAGAGLSLWRRRWHAG